MFRISISHLIFSWQKTGTASARPRRRRFMRFYLSLTRLSSPPCKPLYHHFLFPAVDDVVFFASSSSNHRPPPTAAKLFQNPWKALFASPNAFNWVMLDIATEWDIGKKCQLWLKIVFLLHSIWNIIVLLLPTC